MTTVKNEFLFNKENVLTIVFNSDAHNLCLRWRMKNKYLFILSNEWFININALFGMKMLKT